MDTLFISDLHLDAAEPAAGAQFLDFLRTRAPTAEALYVLGDLFETWIGDDDDDPFRAAVCDALAALADRGVPCYVMHGNRDFLLGAGFERRTGARLLADPTLVRIAGEPVLLTHGDALCTGDQAYQRLRSIVRDARWQRRFLRLSLPARRVLAAQARAGSRRHTGRSADYLMDVDQAAVEAVMRACGVRTLIHGHTHRPAVHEFLLDGADVRRIVLGAWHEAGSCLVAQADRFDLQALPRAPRGAAPQAGGPE